ncbi:DUF1573 domain-containing protein [Roseivirga sp.]|uniref:DUF1573 domain-containing protein n=1 Tax=Roseivirga sp. TaxID=1964215 RepID=UPI003B8C6258
MKNIKFIAIIVLAGFTGFFVKSNYRNWIGSNLVLENDMYDFGDIEEGSKARYYIRFKNAGLMSLKLNDVSADCGCTVVDWGEGEISSGAIDSVLIEYDTNKIGLINRIVTFNSNSRNSPHAFYLIGNVMPRDITSRSSTNPKESSISMDK